MAAIFDLPPTSMSESVHTYTELLDPENAGVACGISLLSSIEAEMLRCLISTSGMCRFDSPRTYIRVFRRVPYWYSVSEHMQYANSN